MTKKAYLVLSDGRVFQGISFGYEGEAEGEVVFNTSITGYQEILTDPSYHGQIVTMTYPHIGNCGCNPDDMESERAHVSGLVVRSYCEIPSNWRSRETLAGFLTRHRIVAGTGFDTRSIVRHVRDNGARPALLIAADELPGDAMERAALLPSMNGQDLASRVTRSSCTRFNRTNGSAVARNVVLYDFGVKQNIIRMLQATGCDVTVVPASTTAEQVLKMRPDGVMLSNGPGDPAAVTYAVDNIKRLLGKVPMFGICLGHQLLALALGLRTFKLKFGHRGANQPVRNLRTGKVEITSQNHGFAVGPSGLCAEVEVTHINLNDGTVEGLAAERSKAFSVQYHPEASPGPHDAAYLFDQFFRLMGPT